MQQRLSLPGQASMPPPPASRSMAGALPAEQPGGSKRSLKPMPGRVATSVRMPSRRYSSVSGRPGGSEQQGPAEAKPGVKPLPCWLVIILLPIILPAALIMLPFTLLSLCCCPTPPKEEDGGVQAGQQQGSSLARKTTDERMREHDSALASVDAAV
jgi:hypothetical protein